MSKFNLMNDDEIELDMESNVKQKEIETLRTQDFPSIILVNTGSFLINHNDIIRRRGVNISDNAGLIVRINPIVTPAIEQILTPGTNLTITIPAGRNLDHFIIMSLANDIDLFWEPVYSGSNEYAYGGSSVDNE